MFLLMKTNPGHLRIDQSIYRRELPVDKFWQKFVGNTDSYTFTHANASVVIYHDIVTIYNEVHKSVQTK